ncbi:hypothetical protein B0T22DRAFT_130721 [Podospora appendiculata]|uniref:Secreted protein n=1 Tax=Podospora appendiculata TaxID=314037 RepID=A0AAE0X816_9PEZI|nr:hypothetical protein B0T22DRAFT_130721 [Podospora appendiculata]
MLVDRFLSFFFPLWLPDCPCLGCSAAKIGQHKICELSTGKENGLPMLVTGEQTINFQLERYPDRIPRGIVTGVRSVLHKQRSMEVSCCVMRMQQPK